MKKNLPSPSQLPVVTDIHKTNCLAICLFFITATASGQVELVKDINQNHNPYDNEYKEAIDRDGTLFFISNTELWKTNGTTTANFMVKRFRQIQYLTYVAGTIFFAADDGTGLELWKTTGTTAGTVKVKEILPGAAGSDPQQLTVIGNSLYFVANNGTHGRELWKSDGTISGTIMVKDVYPKGGSSNPAYLANVNGVLFFAANDGVNGYELWRSNGTSEGTVLVKDIKAGYRTSSAPRFITNVNGVALFTADDGIMGRELWKSDGTPQGTYLVKDLRPGSQGCVYNNMIDVNGTLFFSANDGVHGEELWKSDGTSQGTILVKDLTPGARGSGYSGYFSPTITNFTNINGLLYFTAHKNGRYYFWKSDGTEAGTVNFLPAESVGIMNLKAEFRTMNGNVFFYNGGGRNGDYIMLDLMKEDPYGKISKVTSLLLNDYYSSINQLLVRSRNLLYLTGRRNENEGYSLFKTIGTPSGTHWVTDSYVVRDQSSDPHAFTQVGDLMYFIVTINDRQSLWKTDGTEAGTAKVKDMRQLGLLTNVNGKLFFSGVEGDWSSDQWDIYKSDGTEAGTIRIGAAVNATRLVALNNKLFYVRNSHELWVTDGTTHQHLVTGQYLHAMYPLGNYLYFAGYDNVRGSELWRTDGTPQGTALVKDINPNSGHSEISLFTDFKGILYFVANDGVHGHEVWRSDGTNNGTYMLKDVRTSDSNVSSLHDIRSLVAVNDKLYFLSQDESGGWKLWKSNGTSAGTVALSGLTSPTILMPSNNRVYFLTFDGTYELWKSDGTQQTTNKVAEISSYPYFWPYINHISVTDKLYFVTIEGDLWRSDGTACGTHKIEEVRLGYYNPFAALGQDILFGGQDEQIGTELFKINVNNISGGPCNTFTANSNARTATPEDDSTIDFHINHYPNPFQSAFSIRVAGESGNSYTVDILDIKSQTAEHYEKMPYNETHTIGHALAPGLYFLKILEGSKMTVNKIIKE